VSDGESMFVSSVYAIWNYSSFSTFKYEIPRFPLVCPSCSVHTDYYYYIRTVLCFGIAYLVWWSLYCMQGTSTTRPVAACQR